MTNNSPMVYALYVEKQMIGKRVKGSKVKVSWKFCTEPNLEIQEVVVLHSVMSGKRVITLNGNPIFQIKKLSTGLFEHNFKDINNVLDLTIHIRDGFDGFSYELLTDGRLFHKNKNLSLSELEQLRNKNKNANNQPNPVTTATSFKSFTKHNSSSLDATGQYHTATNPVVHANYVPQSQPTQQRKESLDLLGMSPVSHSQPTNTTYYAPPTNPPQQKVAVKKIKEPQEKSDPFKELLSYR
eukprot:snap_masked-scaffold_52-processed-gene-0.17-mRNA-1 protein AED:0.31 eAED:0.31 QI:0/-1/0/1/-1/1/1/0/239